MDAPAVLAFSETEMVHERDAKLLEVGAYPDKGLTVTEADLDGIVARFSDGGAPIKVEHMDTPLDPLGRVQKVWRDGNALMAKLLFPEDLAGFLRRRGVQKLSVGLSREKVGLGLAEVSLVLKPRVAAAAMLNLRRGSDREDAEIVRLESRTDGAGSQRADRGAEGGGAGGAGDGNAGAGAAVGSRRDADHAVGRHGGGAGGFGVPEFLNAQPPVVKFGETAGGTAEPQEAALSSDEADWLQQTLGVDPDKVAALDGAREERGDKWQSLKVTSRSYFARG